ncbi:YARHG domain-containing protein [Lacibacter cauensis]|uniref:YARHG domain-containing protein n=1 Tax=Lacibacter cauensis TaxID=510947 RepID=A0A562SFU9_9BACT|nr:YARHG domain-containing protein [Lacibacter cauensis]TWI80211.1 YARHG domain-containing protein [Lacibacter cauensis]
MKKSIVVIALLSLLACNEQQQPAEKDNVEKEVVKEDTSFLQYNSYFGSWVGDFIAEEYSDGNGDGSHSNKINLVLKRIEGDSVFGQSIVAGNSRAFKGVLRKKDSLYEFQVQEPGDEKYDGLFTFSIKDDTLKGNWTSFRKDLPVVKRRFALVKSAFVYNSALMLPDDMDYVDYVSGKTEEVIEENEEGVKDTFMVDVFRAASEKIFELNASEKELKEADVKNLKKIDLEIIRNTIYARHGYTFKKRTYRQFFDYVDWYIPISTDVTASLTEVEKKNIALLNRFEKYAEDHYDGFGR